MCMADLELHPALVHHIVNSLGWPRLRPLQQAAIEPLLAGEHAMLVAPTAGGKTEAAFFPTLSRMMTEDWRGLSVLYLCPLRALLNNLHVRLDGYSSLVGRRVGLWHGDVGHAERSRLLREPPDILLTTPESLESMLISRRVDHQDWFLNVRTVIVDEAHAFGGDDRGWHLLAVLERISRLAGREVQRVALSATIGNPDQLLGWMTQTCSGARQVIQPATDSPQEPEITLDHVGSLDSAATVISRLHRGEKRLVFVESRARAEHLTAALRNLDVNVFVSHGSLSRDDRHRAEQAFAEERDAVIVATSTLELGIDVGDLDRMIQIDSPTTVASFLQRLGRTGRRSGTGRNALFLATSSDALLTGAGVLHRWSQGYVEPVSPPPLPAHLLAHQCLAIVLQEGGAGEHTWARWLGDPLVFGADVSDLVPTVTRHLIESGLLDDQNGVLGLGVVAEEEYGWRHFLELLSVFTSEPLLTALHGRQEVGRVSVEMLQLAPSGAQRSLLLGGRTWRVRRVDWARRTVDVEPVRDEGFARWHGGSPPLTRAISTGVRDVLAGTDPARVTLGKRAVSELDELRTDAWWVSEDRTAVVRDDSGRVRWWTFGGVLANNWLAGAIPDLRRDVRTVESHWIALDVDTEMSGVAERLRSVRDSDLALAGGVARDAIEGLKFAEMLPGDLAADVVTRRLDRRRDAGEVLQEPVTVVG